MLYSDYRDHVEKVLTEMASSHKNNFGVLLVALAVAWLAGGSVALSNLFFGFVHGALFLITFVLSWFTSVDVFDAARSGFWYNAGFVSGVLCIVHAKGMADKANYRKEGYIVAERDLASKIKVANEKLATEMKLRAKLETELVTCKSDAYNKGYAAAKKLGELANTRHYDKGLKAGKAEALELAGAVDGLTYHTMAAKYHEAIQKLDKLNQERGSSDSQHIFLMRRIDTLENELKNYKRGEDAKAA